MCPQLLKKPKCGSHSETTKEEKTWNTFLSSQHFKGRRVCYIFEMGLKRTHKKEFKMKSTCTTKKRKWLMQVECKWCNALNKDNLKHKLYTTCNLWEEASIPPYNIICDSLWVYNPNDKFKKKIETLVVPKLWTLISSSNQTFLEHVKALPYSLEKDLSKLYHAPIGNHLTPALRGFMVKNQIPNLIFTPYFDHNSCISCLNE